MRQLFPRRRAASTSRAFSRRIQASEQCTRVPRSNAVGRCDADRGERASRALDRHAAPPGRRSPHRRASRLPGLGWTDARRCNPYRCPSLSSPTGSRRFAGGSALDRPTHFRKPRRLRTSDWRRMSPVPARPQPSGDPRPARPCLVPPRVGRLDVLALARTKRLRIYPSCSIRRRGA